jgi:uncharacterized membrane protein
VHPSLTSLRLAAVATGACLALVALRMHLTGTPEYRFLGWNLFLAWLPAAFALIAARLRSGGAVRAAYYGFAFLWLLFLPNAPYLVTDVVHLRIEGTDHLWVDVPMLACGSLAGMVLGLSSLRSMHAVVEERLGVRWGWAFVASVSALVGPGLYLGRVRRFNSWQVASHPQEILGTVLRGLFDPTDHLRGLLLVAACTVAFGAAYLAARRWDAVIARDARRR